MKHYRRGAAVGSRHNATSHTDSSATSSAVPLSSFEPAEYYHDAKLTVFIQAEALKYWQTTMDLHLIAYKLGYLIPSFKSSII